jgi:5-methylcytosine-specific restriction endonuclease McrA
MTRFYCPFFRGKPNYNIRENRLKVYERDDYKCKYCSKQLTRSTVTLDHITPVARRR